LDQYGKARQDAARKYSAAFEGHKNIVAPNICDICDCHVFHQYTLRIVDADRDGLMKHLLKIFHVRFITQFHTHKKHI
jgi:dTDP-4-amino-4,6-dideoxygalactose transaminase